MAWTKGNLVQVREVTGSVCLFIIIFSSSVVRFSGGRQWLCEIDYETTEGWSRLSDARPVFRASCSVVSGEQTASEPNDALIAHILRMEYIHRPFKSIMVNTHTRPST